MKYFLLSLLVISGVANALPGYPDTARFKEYNIYDTDGYLLKDAKTGCEYITKYGDNSGYTLLVGSCNKDTPTQSNGVTK